MPVWLLYIIILPSLPLFFAKRKKYDYIPFLLLTIVSMFRYDLVSDYAPYLQVFYDVKREGVMAQFERGLIFQSEGDEIGYLFINKLFGYLPGGWVLLFASYIAVLYYIIYKELKRYDVVCIGTFFFIVLNNITYFDNVVRQAICVALFLYAFRKYIYEGNFKRFVPIVLIGATIHTSMLYTLLLYPLLRWFKEKNISLPVSVVGITLAYLFSVSHIANDILLTITDMINYRGRGGIDSEELTGFNSGLGLLLKTVMYYLPYYLYMTSNNRNKDYDTLFRWYYLYVLLLIVFNDIWVFSRMFYYLVPVPIIAFSLLGRMRLNPLSRLIYMVVVLYLFVGYAKWTYNYYGDYPYKTVLSEDARQGRVYVRSHIVLQAETDRKSFNYIQK